MNRCRFRKHLVDHLFRQPTDQGSSRFPDLPLPGRFVLGDEGDELFSGGFRPGHGGLFHKVLNRFSATTAMNTSFDFGGRA